MTLYTNPSFLFIFHQIEKKESVKLNHITMSYMYMCNIQRCLCTKIARNLENKHFRSKLL